MSRGNANAPNQLGSPMDERGLVDVLELLQLIDVVQRALCAHMSHGYSNTDRHIHRDRQTDTQTDRHTDRQTHKQRQTDRQTDRERDSEVMMYTIRIFNANFRTNGCLKVCVACDAMRCNAMRATAGRPTCSWDRRNKNRDTFVPARRREEMTGLEGGWWCGGGVGGETNKTRNAKQ